MRALALLAVLILTACKGTATEDGKQGRGGRGGLAYTVEVSPVEVKKAAYLVTAPGTIDAFERVQVTARVAGAVDRVAFTDGQEVKKGDVLVVIDSERFRVAVDSAQAAVDKADVAVRDAEAALKRREGASGQSPGLIPGEELETYRTKVASAKADRAVAAAAIRTAQINLRDSAVRAPIAGVIQTRTIETGQYVQPGFVMATLLRSEPMLLRFQVEPAEAPRLKLGMNAQLAMRETTRAFAAKITLVAGAADPTTHMVPITAEIVDDGHKYWLRPGSFCDVTVELDAQREAPMVPRLAARATDHGYVAYVVEGDVAHERKLTLGMSTRDGFIEVRTGLAKGDLLVVRGAEALSEGAKVKIATGGTGAAAGAGTGTGTGGRAGTRAATTTTTTTATATATGEGTATGAGTATGTRTGHRGGGQ